VGLDGCGVVFSGIVVYAGEENVVETASYSGGSRVWPQDRFSARSNRSRDRENQLPFDIVGADTFYARDGAFRDHLASRGKRYMVSIPCDLPVWQEEPVIGIPEKRTGQRGPAYKHEQVLSPSVSLQVRALRQELEFEPVYVRDCERGQLVYEHAFAEVWTVREEARRDGHGNAYKGVRAVKELLVIRKEKMGKYSYRLSNAPITTEKRTLAQWKANRHFVERTIQETKTEAGWDDLQSAKYRATCTPWRLMR
jgi:hypothetical protein